MTSQPKKGATRRKAKRPTAQRTPKRKAVTKPYEQTPEERVAVESMAARIKDLPVAPRVKVSEKGGVAQLSPDHPDFRGRAYPPHGGPWDNGAGLPERAS